MQHPGTNSIEYCHDCVYPSMPDLIKRAFRLIEFQFRIGNCISPSFFSVMAEESDLALGLIIGNIVIPSTGCFLSCMAIPIDGYIIYRLLSKEVAKSYYFRLNMFMSALDIFLSFSGAFDLMFTLGEY